MPWLFYDEGGWAAEGLRHLQENALWRDLPVVRAGHVYRVDKYWARSSPRTAGWMLTDIERDVLGMAVTHPGLPYHPAE
jgi:ABC-type Fe3+-hydroxamate transport system substrate-binding protein